MVEAKRRQVIGYNESIIERAVRKFDDEQILVQLHMRNGVMGYALRVTRLIFDEEYSYTGWVSMQAFRLQPWPIDQRHMIDRAFAASVQDVIKAKGN